LIRCALNERADLSEFIEVLNYTQIVRITELFKKRQDKMQLLSMDRKIELYGKSLKQMLFRSLLETGNSFNIEKRYTRLAIYAENLYNEGIVNADDLPALTLETQVWFALSSAMEKKDNDKVGCVKALKQVLLNFPDYDGIGKIVSELMETLV
jgi:hypothetical protein